MRFIIILVLLSTALAATAKNPYFKPFVTSLSGSVSYVEGNFKYKKDAEQVVIQNIFQAGTKPEDDSLADAGLKRKAKWAKWLGIGSLIGLLVPGVNLLSIPAAIAAIVISHQIPKESRYNKEANTGKKTGWLTIGVLLVIGFIVLLVTLPFGVR